SQYRVATWRSRVLSHASSAVERSSTGKEAHSKQKPNKSLMHSKEADSKHSPGIKAVSTRDPNYTEVRR
ncbi:MAG: hypothetical protein ACK53Y_20555, partial [bacterium]